MIAEPTTLEEEIKAKTDSSWSLVACSSWLSGQNFDLPQKPDLSPITVGRGKDCDIIFPGTHLSREHVEIYVQETGLLIKDLNSANGTYINDQRVKQGFLRPGDTLRLDVYSFTVEGPELSDAQQEQAAEQIKLEFLKDVANNEVRAPVVAAEDKAEELKQNAKAWKTKPTSPGNRQEDSNNVTNLSLKITASVLLCVVIGLCAYLAFA